MTLPEAILLAAAWTCAPLAAEGEPAVVERVDLARYMGTWYEISALPNFPQRGCTDTVVHYALREDGDVDLANTCRKGGKLKVYRGRGRVLDPRTNAKLHVRFFLWLGTPYWIVALDPDYRWAAVGTPERDRLWIISRRPALEPEVYAALTERLKGQGFDVDGLVRTVHSGGPPPDVSGREGSPR